ncbi:MAG: hypothetical protein HFG89_15300 [Dorea sp.]|nr:hypothetical protein [Dorea sp.]
MCSLMKFTGKLKQPIIDFMTHRLTILFEPNEDFRQAYEELKDCDKLSLEIKPYRRKRSLDANRYYWVLLTKLAGILGTSNAELHNILLSKHGFMEIVDGKMLPIPIPDTDTAEMSRLIEGLVGDCRDVGMADAEIASPEDRRILKEKYGIDV